MIIPYLRSRDSLHIVMESEGVILMYRYRMVNRRVSQCQGVSACRQHSFESGSPLQGLTTYCLDPWAVFAQYIDGLSYICTTFICTMWFGQRMQGRLKRYPYWQGEARTMSLRLTHLTGSNMRRAEMCLVLSGYPTKRTCMD